MSFQGTTSIALHPPSGRLCYTALAAPGGKTQTEVNCAWMDGRNKAVLWRKSSIPTSLVFSSQGNMIYWADTGEELKCSLLDDFCWLTLRLITLFRQVKASSAPLEWMGQDINSTKQGQGCSSLSHIQRTSSSGPRWTKVRIEALAILYNSALKSQIPTMSWYILFFTIIPCL